MARFKGRYRMSMKRFNMAYRRRRFSRAFSARSYSKRGFGATVSLPLIAGGVAGWMAPRVVPYQDLAITTLAVLPIRLPYNLKHAAQGYVLGMIAKGFVGGGGTGTVTNSDFA